MKTYSLNDGIFSPVKVAIPVENNILDGFSPGLSLLFEIWGILIQYDWFKDDLRDAQAEQSIAKYGLDYHYRLVPVDDVSPKEYYDVLKKYPDDMIPVPGRLFGLEESEFRDFTNVAKILELDKSEVLGALDSANPAFGLNHLVYRNMPPEPAAIVEQLYQRLLDLMPGKPEIVSAYIDFLESYTGFDGSGWE